VVIVKEIYILAGQAKTLRHRLTISENAWFLESPLQTAFFFKA